MGHLNHLNDQQREAASTIDGPVLILAGAGTGKTSVLTARIAHMVATGILPDQILGVTFTNKAAREMQSRVAQATGITKGPKPTLCTFHSLCVRILRRHIDRLGYKKNFVIYSDSEQIGVMKKILSSIQTGTGARPDAREVLSLLSRYRNAGGRLPKWTDPGVAALAEHVSLKYESALKACNAVDFDDLILLVLRLFQEHPDALEDCRQRYRYVMVDEYQDTNATQFQLVHALTLEHRNLCVVGDDDQSIYGWRGAEVANLLELEKYYPEVRVVKLERNYRSTNMILRAANGVIKNNPRRRPKELWSGLGEGEKVLLQTYEDDDAEAQGLVEDIEYARLMYKVSWGEQAILFRTNIQSRPVETALRRAKVPYRLVGGQSFFDRREIRDFLAWLKTLYNPFDEISLLRIANVPARGLTPVTMERLLAASHERNVSVWAAMRHTDVQESFRTQARNAIVDFLGLVEESREPLTRSEPLVLSRWILEFLEEIGYWAELRRLEKNEEAAENRIRNLRELITTMDEAGGPPDAPLERLQSFLEDITLDADRTEDKETRGDQVTLITMHSAKGLEYPHVHVVGMEEGILPHTRSKEEDTLDEERRLFYVAITRARESLSISHCRSRRKYGQKVPCQPSCFLQELPEECVEHGEEKGSRPVSIEETKSRFDSLRSILGG